MKVADLEKMIELSEYENSGVNIELSPDIDQKVQELTEIIKSVPVKIWEKLGYEGYTSVDVERRERLSYYQNPENITIVLKGEHNISHISGVGIRNIFWELAKYSKRYNDFCIKMCQRDISWLKAQDRFISEDRDKENSKETIARMMDMDSSCGMYNEYFKKLKLKRSVTSYCIRHQIVDEVAIAETKKRFVLEAFVRMTLDDVNYFEDEEEYQRLRDYGNEAPKNKIGIYEFWHNFLRDDYNLKTLYEYTEANVATVMSLATEAERLIFNDLKTIDYVREITLYNEKKKYGFMDNHILMGKCIGFARTVEAIFFRACANEETKRLDYLEDSDWMPRRFYDFMLSNVDRYKELMDRDFEDFEREVKCSYVDQRYTAEMSMLKPLYENRHAYRGLCSIGEGKTEEEAIANMREHFEENKKNLIVDIINLDYPQYVKDYS